MVWHRKLMIVRCEGIRCEGSSFGVGSYGV